MTTSEHPLATLTKGILAGATATATMVATRNALWNAENEQTRERERQLRQGAEQTGLQKPVRATADRLDIPLTQKQEQHAGETLAWTLGISGVIGYAYARHRWPQITKGQGLAFGAGVWLIEDETLWPLLGLAKPPQHYPWQAHARGLAAHLAYGLTAETTLQALDKTHAATHTNQDM